MNGLTLKQLRYFQAVANHQHFGRAAEACAVSQPALSMQIKELEETLGVVLFERGARRARLTAFGDDFLERVRAILTEVDELGELARASQGEVAGRFRIGVIPTIAPYFLPKLIRELTAQFPRTDFHIRETITPRLVSEVTDGQLDAAILALPVAGTGLAQLPLFSENLVLVRPSAEAASPVPDRQSLRDMRVLHLEEGHCFRDQAMAFCNAKASKLQEDMAGSTLSTLVQLVGAGLGVTLIPEMAVHVETQSADVVVSQFHEPRPKRTVGMIFRESTPLAAQLRRICDVIREVNRG